MVPCGCALAITTMKALLPILIMASFISKLFGGEHRKPYDTAEIYLSLRQQIFDLPKTNANFGQTDRWAILMETGLEDACYTLVAVSDGSASLYFSNGGGIIGGGQHPEGAAAAKAFLELSRKFDSHLSRSTERPLPRPGMTRFYIVRKDDVLTGEFKEDDLGNGRLPLSLLFHKGHELITVIRTIEQKRIGEPDGANRSQPIRAETNPTSGAVGSDL